MKHRLVIAGLIIALTSGLGPTDAAAAPGDSTVTFDITSGSLTITVPGAAALGSGAPDSTIVGQMGNITVTDSRAAADASWTAEVKATDFTSGAGGPGHIVPATAISYSAGTPSSTVGNGTFTPGPDGPLDTATLHTAFSHVGGTGNNAVTWNPSLTVTVDQANAAGVYTGTVTHSVA
jgi:hypothetical protein